MDVDAVVGEHLNDYPTGGCDCKECDYRPAMRQLADEVRRLQAIQRPKEVLLSPEKAIALLAIVWADGNMGVALAEMTKLAFNAETSVVTLEGELANANEELTAYKDFYGTSVAQVKHLRECTECTEPSCCEHGWTCPEYSTET